MNLRLFALVLVVLIIFTNCKEKTETGVPVETESPVAEKVVEKVLSEAETIAYKHGFEHWDEVEQLDFTFNVDRGGKLVAQRKWSWKPKSDEVTLNDTLTYNRKTMDSLTRGVDGGFINDKFWLLIPFQLVWDKDITITVVDTATTPLSRKQLKKMTIVYPDTGGYTPGDAYDLYYDTDFTIREWAFRKSNAPEPSLVNTFEAYEEINGIKMAMDHRNEAGGFSLYFTDVNVIKEQ